VVPPQSILSDSSPRFNVLIASAFVGERLEPANHRMDFSDLRSFPIPFRGLLQTLFVCPRRSSFQSYMSIIHLPNTPRLVPSHIHRVEIAFQVNLSTSITCPIRELLVIWQRNSMGWSKVTKLVYLTHCKSIPIFQLIPKRRM
jgi:hypothetical protein